MASKFRADRVRTLRKFFQKVGKTTTPDMADMGVIFEGDMTAPDCGSVGCVQGWTLALFSKTPLTMIEMCGIQASVTANRLLGTSGEYGPMVFPKFNYERLFSAQRHGSLPGWKEAVNRLSKLLRMHNEPLRGPMAPIKRTVDGIQL